MRLEELRDLKGLLADMDGVWFVGDRPVTGAIEALAAFRARGIPIRFVTNTTTKTSDEMAAAMRLMGFDVEAHEFTTTPAAAVSLLQARGIERVRLVVSGAIRGEFSDFSTEAPQQAIVIGDIGRAWSYDLMSELFRLVMGGAEMVALHKGRYWQVQDGLALDIGAFVAGLEYATGKKATVIGKPSAEMYRAALVSLGLQAKDVVMVGDDVHHDIAGAQAAGIRGVLVKTGKYREELVAASGVKPDLVLEDIATLVARL